METTRELSALFTLIDDPDEEVFGAVSTKIVDYGKNVIPNLEHLWETTPNEQVQSRIEQLIHRLHFNDLYEDFRQWAIAGHHDLMLGALLTARYFFHELTSASLVQEMEKIKRNIWLELNNYLTPLEQVHVIASILYNYFGLKGCDMNYKEPNEFLLNKTLETKRGNQLGNAVLYLALCELLDVPVKAINVPRQFLLAYFKPGYSAEELPNPVHKIEFYIDPLSGSVHTTQDIEAYFKQIAVPPVGAYFRPQKNKQVIATLLIELGKCFNEEKDIYRKNELNLLASLLD